MLDLAVNKHPFVIFLKNSGIVDDERASQLESLIRTKSGSPLSIAARTGMVPNQTLLKALINYTGWLQISASELSAMLPMIKEAFYTLQIQNEWCKEMGIILWETETNIFCCTIDLISPSVQEMLRIFSLKRQKSIIMRVCRNVDFENIFSELATQKQLASANSSSLAHLRELAEEGPIVELVNNLLSQAVTRRASDIHIEPGESIFTVRIRVDGVMRELQSYPLDRFDATICRVKILSQLDIAERRLPQDGRLTGRIHGEVFDVRVSVLPGSNGESIVMRLLRQDRPDYNLSDLGMLADDRDMFERWIRMSDGIVLVTGPTGSGKTTTLYTALDIGNDGLKKIITVEDPVEYKLDGITQVQVNADIGFTFASSLRSILRHDPDVILIGEIRDAETAGIAVQSALTGHLVFSTLHTNSAVGAVTRLADMGIERFLISSSLRGVIAQRLIRRLCPHCSQDDVVIDQTTLDIISKIPGYSNIVCNFKKAVGCDVCLHTGFLGRIAVYEFLEVDVILRSEILRKVSEFEITSRLRRNSVRSMKQDGLLKAVQGITTVSEALMLSEGD